MLVISQTFCQVSSAYNKPLHTHTHEQDLPSPLTCHVPCALPGDLTSAGADQGGSTGSTAPPPLTQGFEVPKMDHFLGSA